MSCSLTACVCCVGLDPTITFIMVQKDTEAEAVLKAKYALLRELKLEGMQTTRDFHLKYARKRVTIKQPTLSPSKRSAEKAQQAKLTPLEKAKLVLRAEARAREEEQQRRDRERKQRQATVSPSAKPAGAGGLRRPKRDRTQQPSAALASVSASAAELATIYVSNLPPDCDEEELSNLFQRYGMVSTVRLVRQDKQHKTGVGQTAGAKYAFVCFTDPAVARRIVEMSTRGRAPPELRPGRQLYINWSQEEADAALGAIAAAVAAEPEPSPTPPPRPMVPGGDALEGGRNVVSYDEDFL